MLANDLEATKKKLRTVGGVWVEKKSAAEEKAEQVSDACRVRSSVNIIDHISDAGGRDRSNAEKRNTKASF